MPTFAFQARDSRGAQVEGTRDAPDQRTALTALREAGFFVTKLVPVAGAKAAKTPTAKTSMATAPTANVADAPRKPSDLVASETRAEAQKTANAEAMAAPNSNFEYSKQNVPSPATTPNVAVPPASGQDLWAYANAKELSLFFRQMHSMLHSGTSISRALQVYAEHAGNNSLKRAALQMSRETGEGRPLSQSMRSFPGLFSVLMISMTDAGERGGRLDTICSQLADYSERDFELEQSVKRETLYPKILVVCAILIPSVSVLVLRGFTEWRVSMTPPLLLIAFLYVVFVIVRRVMKVTGRDGAFRLGLDSVKMYIPGVSGIARALATAKFARAIGALYASGVGAEHAMRLAGESCGNALVSRRVSQVAPRLVQGIGFTQSMKEVGYFPPIAIQMMATGEESGAIDTQLAKVADFLETEVETAIRKAVKIFGVLVFLCVAFYIGYLVIQFYTGYGNEIGNIVDQTGA